MSDSLPPEKILLSEQPGKSLHPYVLFAFFWSLALLSHQAKVGEMEYFSAQSLVSFAAIWLLLRPSSLSRLLVMVVVQVVCAGIKLPFVTNHWMLVTLANLSILLCWAVARVQQNRKIDAVTLYDYYAPILRLELILFYGFATLAKLNTGFFDLATSCGATMYGWLLNKLFFLPSGSWIDLAIIYSTIVIEGAIPLLLLFRRTRLPGIILGLAFHLILTINMFFDFSATMTAFYCLFLSQAFVDKLENWWQEHPFLQKLSVPLGRWSRSPLTFPVLAVILVFIPAIIAPIGQNANDLGRLFWIILTLALLWVLIECTWRDWFAPQHRFAFRPKHWICLLGPLLLIFNGLNPYLGLRTESSFTMFSNLQTEGNQWNHLFMPPAMRIFPLQTDLVTVISSSDPAMQKAAEQGTRFTYWHFHQLLSQKPETAITYVYQGQKSVLARVGDDPVLSQPVDPLSEKILWMRSVPTPENNTCGH